MIFFCAWMTFVAADDLLALLVVPDGFGVPYITGFDGSMYHP